MQLLLWAFRVNFTCTFSHINQIPVSNILALEFLTKQVHGRHFNWVWSQAVFSLAAQNFVVRAGFSTIQNCATRELNTKLCIFSHHTVLGIFVILFLLGFLGVFQGHQTPKSTVSDIKWWKKSATIYIHDVQMNIQTDMWTAMINIPSTGAKNMTKLNLLQNYTISTLHLASAVQKKSSKVTHTTAVCIKVYNQTASDKHGSREISTWIDAMTKYMENISN